MRRFPLAASFISVMALTMARADDPPFQLVQPPAPKLVQAPVRRNPAVVLRQYEEELEVLEAQRDGKKGHQKLAEYALKAAERNLALTELTQGDVEKAKLDIEVAKTQVEIRLAEVKEVEVKIKYARKRLEEAKAAAMPNERGDEKGDSAARAAAGFGVLPLQGEVTRTQYAVPLPNAGMKIAVFNMAAVMKHYEKAKQQVVLLNDEKNKLMAEIAPLQAKQLKLQQEIRHEQNPAAKEKLQLELMEVTRELEDKNREINSELNKRAATIIAGLYDEIKIVVDKLAEKHGCQIVFAYPEGVTTEDFNNPYLKELKLKPSAAQPWYVSKQVDLTEEVIQSLNARHAAPHTLKSLVFPACLHLAQRH